jgi:cytoskeletal protein CcmA (bactofilin family)
MRNTHKLLVLGAAIVVMLVVASAIKGLVAGRARVDSDHIIINDSYSLTGVVNQPLVVAANSIQLSADSRVAGSASLISRSGVNMDGAVEGNLTVMSDSLTLGEDSHVAGDLSFMGSHATIDGRVDGSITLVGGNIMIAPTAHINGGVFACGVTGMNDARADAPAIQPCSEDSAVKTFGPFGALAGGTANMEVLQSGVARSGGYSRAGLLLATLLSLAFTGMGVLAVTLFPRQFSHIEEAVRATPRSLSGVGCMTGLLAVGIGAVLVLALAALPPLGLLLLPVAAAAGILLVGMVVAGWITLALIVGDWLLRRVTRAALPPLVAVACGSLALCVVWNVLALVPFGLMVGLLAAAILGSVGLGGTLLTRMGTRPLRRSYFVQG